MEFERQHSMPRLAIETKVTRSVLLAAFILAASPPAVGQQATLEGSWRGGGTVILPSGDHERAHCRATFRRSFGNNYGMSAVCATASVRLAQSAKLVRVSAERFTGGFYNSEYNISGTIAITVHGNHLSASLRGDSGTAHFNLSR
jgi:hypothetical protein